ncbi:hypothetical protein [Pontibacter virosus]|uniref:Uncharacterized protein n=1 Tax=Pontibacter virosus TaxID=1765052 RepID=A0A2U1B3T8_9BACT|nr:hypothetical protein [Pontibacter virosus]PVY43261.1 hypothetical protein C8E01_102440 [Pontibacter virosus]
MKDNRRMILKQLLNGRIQGRQAAAALQDNGRTIVYVIIENGDGTLNYDGETITQEQWQEKLKIIDPFGQMEEIVIG